MLILQEVNAVSAVATDVLEQSAAPQELHFFDMALKGGWMMIPLAILLVLAIYIFIERLLTIRNASKEIGRAHV